MSFLTCFQFAFSAFTFLKGTRWSHRSLVALTLALLGIGLAPAHAQDAGESQPAPGAAPGNTASDPMEDRFAFHGQATYIWQRKPSFGAAYSGEHSLGTARRLLPNRWDFVALPLIIGLLVVAASGIRETLAPLAGPSAEAISLDPAMLPEYVAQAFHTASAGQASISRLVGPVNHAQCDEAGEYG